MNEQYIKIDENGSKYYYSDAAMKILHRLDGPAVEYAGGDKVWCVHGKCHRLDGPAVEYASGAKAWYVHGKRHRLDGPAIEYSDGTKAWFVDGKPVSQEDINRRTAKEIVLTLDEIAAKFGVSVEQLKITK
jgi:hypothetical protein